MDATLVSPLKRNGQAQPRAHWQNGAALRDAQRNKVVRYPELLLSERCRLVTAEMEVDGRWEEGAYKFLLEVAKGKAEEAPKLLRGSATKGWLRRWTSLLSKAGMDSLASTLLHDTAANTDL